MKNQLYTLPIGMLFEKIGTRIVVKKKFMGCILL